MTKILLDVDFITEYTNDCGFDLVHSAIEHNPKLLMSLLDAGWGIHVRKNNINLSRKFLCSLNKLVDPEVASLVLKNYFKDATPYEINQHVIHSSAQDGKYSPLMAWTIENLSTNSSTAEARKQLIVQAKQMGCDFEHVFTHSIYENYKSKSSENTILSVIVAETLNISMYTSTPDCLRDCDLNGAFKLIKAGKLFDKYTAGVLLRLPSKSSVAWVNAFNDIGFTSAAEVLKLGSRMRSNLETKAVLSSMAAMDAINGIIPKPLQHQVNK